MNSITRHAACACTLLVLGATGASQATPTGDWMLSANSASTAILSARASEPKRFANAPDVVAASAFDLGYDAKALSEVLAKEIRSDLDQRLKRQHRSGN